VRHRLLERTQQAAETAAAAAGCVLLRAAAAAAVAVGGARAHGLHRHQRVLVLRVRHGKLMLLQDGHLVLMARW
jgi:hypothetical protein